jgi:hypothetical protein
VIAGEGRRGKDCGPAYVAKQLRRVKGETMKNRNIGIKVLRILFGVISLCMMLFIASHVIRQSVKPLSNTKVVTHYDTLCPIFTRNESTKRNANSADEKRIARHFVTDTLPGLMQAGLIKKYQRNNRGTNLFVTGNLWSARSQFFKKCLLTEIYTYNKVNGYGLLTTIMDSVSGRLYAQISSSAKMDFYN